MLMTVPCPRCAGAEDGDGVVEGTPPPLQTELAATSRRRIVAGDAFRAPAEFRGSDARVERFAEIECPNQHRILAWFPDPLYQLSWRRGIGALVERNWRSAVIEFYIAWENFVSYALKELVSRPEEQPAIGRMVAMGQELGAFAGKFSVEVGEWPRIPPDEIREIRNGAIHKDRRVHRDRAYFVAHEIRKALLHDKEAIELATAGRVSHRELGGELHDLLLDGDLSGLTSEERSRLWVPWGSGTWVEAEIGVAVGEWPSPPFGTLWTKLSA